MFLTSDSQFRRQYFWSSQILVYILTLISILPQINYQSLAHNIYMTLNNEYVLEIIVQKCISSHNVHLCLTAVLLLVMCIYSYISLNKLIGRLRRNRKTAEPALKSQKSIRLTSKYNGGMLNLFLSLILPLVTSFSLIDYPIVSLTELFTIQLWIFKFFKNSSDFFPNVALVFKNVNLIVGKTCDKEKVYCFAENVRLKDLIGKKVEVRYITAGEYPPQQCICVYVRKARED